jgi:hypothetical protein
MLATRVVKRNGEVVEFDEARIRNAVVKAVRATGKDPEVDEQRLDRLVDRVVEEIGGRFTEFYPNVENIQDIVEKHLVLDGMYEIAKAYILYRASSASPPTATSPPGCCCARPTWKCGAAPCSRTSSTPSTAPSSPATSAAAWIAAR